MKKKIFAIAHSAVIALSLFRAVTPTQESPDLWMATGTIISAEHKTDFSGSFTVRSDLGKDYIVRFDPEDLLVGDRVIFAARTSHPIDHTDPDYASIIRVHSYNVN